MHRLELIGISKQYPAVQANDRVDLRVAPGEIHAVLGENGAGKSTLMKIIYGAVRPDAGEMFLNGERVRVRSPHDARAHGVAMVFQHFSLFDTMTVAENVWLGLRGSRSPADVAAAIRAKAREYGLDVDPVRPVHTLSVGERQRVEVVRALLTDPQLLILDEPTSVLTPQAVEPLFATLRKLAERGCSILYISHKLDEIRALCTACTVLRAGRVTGVVDPRVESAASLSRLMIGAEPPQLTHRAPRPGTEALVADRLILPRRDRFGIDLEAIDLVVHTGEIVGVAGVSGNGQQELLAALAGEDTRAPPASIRLFGRTIGAAGPRTRRRLGLHFVPEERLGRGAVPPLSLAHNLLLTRREPIGRAGWLLQGLLRSMAQTIIARFNVKASGPRATARSLSGGNLQKYIMGREIDARPKVLIAAQPTWGVDIGATAQIRAELLALRDAGCAVLVVSEELDELFEIADRLVVIAKGRLSPAVATQAATREQIGQWMSGLWNGPAAEGAGALV
ncbi:MAG TPA: ABC transporter ATP-binding protein [Burkholderiaceae bacterium]|nr:ABC transporter ATP-binding protein [Burkholderiaceae bacterium]